MQTLKTSLHADIQAILGQDGLLTRDGLTYSPKQLDYALRSASGFCRHNEHSDKTALNLLEAGTGTGKTLAYLVPLLAYAARTGERVMVSTYTRHLQKQILDKDAQLALKWVAEVTGQTLRLARRIGRANYISPLACARLIDDLRQEPDHKSEDAIHLVEQMMDWAEERTPQHVLINSGILDDFLGDMGIESLPPEIPRGRIALTPGAPAEEQQRYEADIQASKEADVLVVNHALVMLHTYRWASILDEQDGRKTSVLVCDEADRLEDAAESIMQADLTLHHLNKTAEQAAAILGTPLLADAIRELHDFAKTQIKEPGKGVMVVTSKDPQSLVLQEKIHRANNAARKHAAAISLKLRGQADVLWGEGHRTELAAFVDAANDLALFAAAMIASDNTAIVSWSPIRSQPSLRIGRPNPGRILSRLWAERRDPDVADHLELPEIRPLKAALFTSATLSVPGRSLPAAFDEFCQSVGIIRHPAKGTNEPIHQVLTELFARYQPAKFGSLQFVLADPRVVPPTLRLEDNIHDRRYTTNPEWLDYVATVVRAAHQNGGRTLVLTLSHRDTQDLAARLQTHLEPSALIIHKDGQGLGAMRNLFVAQANAVLLSPSAWEGVDWPGMIQHLVVTRIPFVPTQNNESEILRAHLFSKGMAEDKIQKVLHNRAVSAARRKLAQGLGRPIRQKDDQATIWITDPRFPLPEEMTTSLDPLFLHEGKQHQIQHRMVDCIPERFRENGAYGAQTRLCLLDGTVYSPQI